MRFRSLTRTSKIAVTACIVLVLTAMMLPVCHMHPLFNPAAADHCTICISLHAALPLGAHVPTLSAPKLAIGRVAVVRLLHWADPATPSATSRAPPLPAC
jgi:hypothetical protein